MFLAQVWKPWIKLNSLVSQIHRLKEAKKLAWDPQATGTLGAGHSALPCLGLEQHRQGQGKSAARVLRNSDPRIPAEEQDSGCHAGWLSCWAVTHAGRGLFSPGAMHPLSFFTVSAPFTAQNEKLLGLVGHSWISHYAYGTRHNSKAIRNKGVGN